MLPPLLSPLPDAVFVLCIITSNSSTKTCTSSSTGWELSRGHINHLQSPPGRVFLWRYILLSRLRAQQLCQYHTRWNSTAGTQEWRTKPPEPRKLSVTLFPPIPQASIVVLFHPPSRSYPRRRPHFRCKISHHRGIRVRASYFEPAISGKI